MIKLYLKPPHLNKGWSLNIEETERTVLKQPDSIIRFKREVMSIYCCWHDANKLPANQTIFFQGDAPDWVMVEFWFTDEDKILEFSEIIAQRLKLNLEIE